ncbi:rhomboid family intramembrane serine protease [Iamia sp.]|uniref:rhomboid family intramembrane serine protease n=1 Tax=Iamia sp. TaxID=2722710 RepID=UPI002C926CB6|nr:rhomboid family intramembrane serine protease [Iamia sp.]HXH56856.1 rhomboid family intramembrane serine protease [Iamia sp.]
MALPLRDDSPRRQVPWVVLTLLALNLAVFLFLQPASLQQGRADTATLSAEQDRELSEHFSAWGAVPCEVRVLESRSDGARCTSDADRPIIDNKPVLASLITAMFLHGSLAHLAVNMLFLWVFGAAVEDRFGPGPFLGLYVVGGVLGTLAYVALNSGSAAPVVGASGAISAAMGAYLVIGARRRILSFVAPLPLVVVALPAWALLAPYLVSQLVTPEDTAVAWQAHVGGMVAGFVLAAGLRLVVPPPGRPRRRAAPSEPALDPASWTLPAAPPTA